MRTLHELYATIMLTSISLFVLCQSALNLSASSNLSWVLEKFCCLNHKSNLTHGGQKGAVFFTRICILSSADNVKKIEMMGCYSKLNFFTVIMYWHRKEEKINFTFLLSFRYFMRFSQFEAELALTKWLTITNLVQSVIKACIV